MASVETEYISVGGNRHPAAADWDVRSGLLAFGADNNVALWAPTDASQKGVYSLLVGHTDKVNVVKFYTPPSSELPLLITGSVDRTIRIWRPIASKMTLFTHAATLEGHQGSINCVAVAEGSNVFVSGAADGTVKVWRITQELEDIQATLVDSITLKPKYFPLALALQKLRPENNEPGMVMAVGGTRTPVQIYAAQDLANGPRFELKATLAGHEAWIRSLEFAPQSESSRDLLLASASQDKYIRLWRVQAGENAPAAGPNVDDQLLGRMQQTLTNKAHVFEINGSKFSVSFEALLFGHEDWIYTVAWNPDPRKPQLLSASADNSLVIWEPDPVSGVWFAAERMGEISVQKGSTTATGSTGGFWIGLWSPDGSRVTCLSRTGSWRVWKYESDAGAWTQTIGVSGHVRCAADLAWEPKGGYLLSTSSDQTTRLHAKWNHDGYQTWHEFSRPQIHGYDLNCISSLGSARFVSGADEKLLRVFNETKAISQLLENLSGLKQDSDVELAEAANIPVLGLSNKVVDDAAAENEEINGENGLLGEQTPAQVVSLDTDHPPLEDHLSRYTLWPEHEKLYGHGYEISAVAASYDRSLIATACKASSIDHAVIRLYDTTTWNEIRPPLTSHSLTITCLRFSQDDQYLLSVGRDRQWTLFERDLTEKKLYRLLTSNPKGHSRMILSASWAPLLEQRVFATAGRDKSVKIWMLDGSACVCKATLLRSSPVTAIDFLPVVVNNQLYLAMGEDSGQISILSLALESLVDTGKGFVFPASDCPSKSITQVSWRPSQSLRNGDISQESEGRSRFELAVASEDSSIRIYTIDNLPK
ncbi:hypothetical protein VTO42DRAFT_659 [Malbranchea cinnamomea]